MEQLLYLGLEREKGRFTLENLIRKYVYEYAYTAQGNLFDQTTLKDVRKTFNEFDPLTAEQASYAAKDAEYTYHLYFKLLKRLEEEKLLDVYQKVEKDFVLVLGDMELTGLPLRKDKWGELTLKSKRKVDEALLELKAYADINWNSPKQVLSKFKEAGVGTQFIDKKTGEIKEGVNAGVLGKGADNPVVSLYIKYKEAMKLYSSYGDKFLKHVSPVDGRIHSSFMQMVDTGRTSSSSPNVQQIPRDPEYRACFEEKDGYTLVIADYSSQEVLLAADLYKEESILEAMASGVDFHLRTASIAYNEEIIDPSDYRRQIAKTIIFATIYGAGPSKIAAQFGMPLKEAKRIVEAVKLAYPNLMSGLEMKFEQTLKDGYITTNAYSKRRIYIQGFEEYRKLKEKLDRFKQYGWDIRPDLKDKLSYTESLIRRKSFNYPIQSSGADMAKVAGAILRKRSLETGLFELVLLAHDEWVVRCREENSQQVAEILSKSMVEASALILTHSKAKAKAIVSKQWLK